MAREVRAADTRLIEVPAGRRVRTLSDVLHQASDTIGRSYRLAAVTAVLLLAGCGGQQPAAGPTPDTSTPASVSAAPGSATPSATPPGSASPTAGSATPSASAPGTATPGAATPTRTPGSSASAASTEDGSYANGLSVSEDGALSYVPLRWYAGEDAEARCAEKQIEAEGAWCVEYYFEEAGDRKAAALTESTRVRLLNDDLKPVDASLTDLLQAIEDEVWPNFQIAVADGKVDRITQVFTP